MELQAAGAASTENSSIGPAERRPQFLISALLFWRLSAPAAMPKGLSNVRPKGSNGQTLDVVPLLAAPCPDPSLWGDSI